MVQAHSERAHALLSASKAAQWINCPPSARLQERLPDKRSEYADQGTVAHELAELKLRRRLTPCNSKQRREIDAAIGYLQQNPLYDAEMESAVNEYVEIVEERFMAAKARSSDATILLEESLDFSEWVPDGYGTGDVVLISDGVLEVIDLKYGKGVPVSAVGNPQIRLYGLGAWNAYNYLYDIREIHGTIVQPRLDNISTDIMSVDELLEWAETVVRPAAALAYEGKGEYKPGDHCRWCKVKGNCRARADANMAALQYEFQDPALLTLDEIGSILHVAEQLSAWAKDVADYAFEQAKAGQKVPGWKLVEGRSNRQITDKDAARSALEAAGLEPADYLKPQDLLGIGDLEKRIGKKELAALIGDLIVKPPGKPVLVPETDKRLELNSVENDFANENFNLED
ncbi:hypothetical protein PACILC2_21670 [Paenibacillus cisolokensis]|uniref:DUF2800 domain-containing protein n=1 Tax=Paenibacillus cisolokensis TaxID=1658519 RepID=A0ABQ4N617_9BACL|nr:DUF2800 domain-containing protein [Paenibacillus cisolokensis]GIQ63599.1 hypothetical protein PACILC2_21670 [Paenibacillus cisolokensis]